MKKERAGLYIMVFITMITTCSVDLNLAKHHKHMKELGCSVNVATEE